MSKFLDEVEQCFGTRDLYAVLGVEKAAKESELKRAYHRLSLQVHPDRVTPEEVEEATRKFQVLGKLHSLLGDEEKRALYDEDGTVDEEDSSVFNQDRDWTDYWRILFKKVTADDIRAFEKNYKGSEEESETLRSAYVDCEGDMDKIMEEVLCATIDDEPRFRDLIGQWIVEGSVPKFPAFVDESEGKRKHRKRRCDEEAREAEEALKEMGADANSSEDSLKALIHARQQSRGEQADNFLDSLEQRYAKKQKSSSSRAAGSKGTKASNSKGTKRGRKK